MNPKTKDVHLRSDRMLVVALSAILAAGSAVVGAAAANHPSTDKIAAAAALPVRVAVATPAAKVPPAPAAAPSRVASGADLALAQLLAEHRCLSEVMYYEARGEGRDGQLAVAEVVFHRLRHGNYGHSICAVVYEGAGSSGCQFSFTCNGDLEETKSSSSWHEAEVLAARILTGQVALKDMTGDATHFHAASIAPDWVGDVGMERTVQIGNHVFYKRTRQRAL
ncbi:MAG: cell wall hydrolase [Alphaproteobacteria bacterium]|nr:cell wall hydrolase [Alphaproteobacteria bacterium]MBV9694358.1 cell wall hydrolase [Alphaproteobacteria bacterium]